MDLNSSKFSSLISDSIVFSSNKEAFIPLFSKTNSTNSVKLKLSFSTFNSSISFLNSNSLPLSIAS